MGEMKRQGRVKPKLQHQNFASKSKVALHFG